MHRPVVDVFAGRGHGLDLVERDGRRRTPLGNCTDQRLLPMQRCICQVPSDTSTAKAASNQDNARQTAGAAVRGRHALVNHGRFHPGVHCFGIAD